jgi:uncharacterized protein
MAGSSVDAATSAPCAQLGRDEELHALRRLDAQARQLERTATVPSLDAFVAGERGRSAALDGRSVFGWEKDLARLDKTGAD